MKTDTGRSCPCRSAGENCSFCQKRNGVIPPSPWPILMLYDPDEANTLPHVPLALQGLPATKKHENLRHSAHVQELYAFANTVPPTWKIRPGNGRSAQTQRPLI